MSRFFKQLRFWLMVSRPGLWFQTVWLYLLPTSPHEQTGNALFWVGFVFVTFPLNFLVYGWNDRVDVDLDAINPRKGNFWFGAQATENELKNWPILCASVLAPFVLFWLWLDRLLLVYFTLIVLVNALYNGRSWGWRSKPPLELINVLGYLVLIPFSALLNQSQNPAFATYLYLGLFCLQAHLMGEIMDMEPDKQANRHTTALLLGQRATKILIMILIASESWLLFHHFQEWLLGWFLAAGLVWLVFDFFYFQRYGAREHKLFAYAMNLFGYASIAWVWWQQSLT